MTSVSTRPTLPSSVANDAARYDVGLPDVARGQARVAAQLKRGEIDAVELFGTPARAVESLAALARTPLSELRSLPSGERERLLEKSRNNLIKLFGELLLEKAAPEIKAQRDRGDRATERDARAFTAFVKSASNPATTNATLQNMLIGIFPREHYVFFENFGYQPGSVLAEAHDRIARDAKLERGVLEKIGLTASLVGGPVGHFAKTMTGYLQNLAAVHDRGEVARTAERAGLVATGERQRLEGEQRAAVTRATAEALVGSAASVAGGVAGELLHRTLPPLASVGQRLGAAIEHKLVHKAAILGTERALAPLVPEAAR